MHIHYILKMLFIVVLTGIFGIAFCAQATAAPPAKLGTTAVDLLENYLKKPASKRSPLNNEPFSSMPVSRNEVELARNLLWEDYKQSRKKNATKNFEQKQIVYKDKVLKYDYKFFGTKPQKGWSLYISLHGGGGAPAQVNDQQWRNQIRLYQPKEGCYLAPRAPTNTWNLWHQSHIDPMFIELIETMVIVKDINPDRIYVLGYSAGGDGVYQLAPRMADRFAAAAMMAGHPNETQPQGLRNLPFILQVGEKDAGYNRNKKAVEFGDKLAELHAADPKGYNYKVIIHKNMGHWMMLKDKLALPWMAKYNRVTTPQKIVWLQDDVLHTNFYWLGVSPKTMKKGELIEAEIKGQTVHLHTKSSAKIVLNLSDELLDLDNEVTIIVNDKKISTKIHPRTIGNLYESMLQRKDKGLSFPCAIPVGVTQ